MRIFTSKQRRHWLERMPKRVSGAAMQLENQAGQVLVVKAGYKPYWTFPGGIIDPGETPKEAAVREVFEEVGLTVSPEAVEFVSISNRTSERMETYQFIFKAPLHIQDTKEIILQASEIEDFALITKAQVVSKDRFYSKAVEHWANNVTGYIEQEIESA